MEGKIVRISGPTVDASGLPDAKMYDMVKVGDLGLMGEIIRLRNQVATIQVYEDTNGLGIGQKVINTGFPFMVELGPGLLTSFYDGVQRPLDVFREKTGNFMARGLDITALSRDKKWDFVPTVKVGDNVVAGQILGTVQETETIQHRIMVPPGIEGKVKAVNPGLMTITETAVALDNGTNITLMQKWPVRSPRPIKKKLDPDIPFVTGQRDSGHPLPGRRRAARPSSRAVSAPARRSSSRRWPSMPRPTSSSTSAAASAATR